MQRGGGRGQSLVDIFFTHPRTSLLYNSSPGWAGGIVRLSTLDVVLFYIPVCQGEGGGRSVRAP